MKAKVPEIKRNLKTKAIVWWAKDAVALRAADWSLMQR